MTDINKERSKLAREETAKALVDVVGPAVFNAFMDATRTCITCDHWQANTEICGLYNARPPAKIIAFGCESYINEIPF